MPQLTREGVVFVLRWDDGENRFRDDSIRAWSTALDEVEAAEGPKALVTTGAGKFYSNGLDLEWALRERKESFAEYVLEVLALLAARLPGQTVHEVIATGRRYGGGDAKAAGIVEETLPEAALLPRALELASGLAGKAHPVMKRLKSDLYPFVLAALRQRQSLEG